MSDTGVLVHKFYCQLREFLINKVQVMLTTTVQILTSEMEPRQEMRNLHPHTK